MIRRPFRTLAAAGACAAALLAGCANQRAFDDGRWLIAEGQYEKGLARLEQVLQSEPTNATYRAGYLSQRDLVMERLLRSGDGLRAAGQFDAAQAEYERAVKLGGEAATIGARLDGVQRDRRHRDLLAQAGESLKKGDRESAGSLVRTVLIENPAQREAQNLMRRIEEERLKEGLAVPALRSRLTKPVSLQFREAPIRQVFDALSRTTGINFVFDREVRPDARATVYVTNVAVEDAIDLILLPAQLEKKVLAENSVLIYPNTPAKQREYQDLVIKTFYLANADVKVVLGLLKTMLKTKDIHIDEKLNLLVMRDTPEAIRLAEKLIAAQDIAEPEVVLEVAVLEISRTRLTELGIRWPDSASLTLLDPSGAAPLLLSELRSISSDRVAVGPTPSVSINARSSRGDSNLLANPRIRVKNRERARILVGDRLPVISAIVTPSTGTPITTETVSYLDVGLKLEVEPNVFLDDDVTIKVALEVSNASNRRTTQNGTTVYDIGTRNANTTLRLKNGETQVLMGLIRDDDRRSSAGLPGLGAMPVLGRLFASHLDDNQKTEIVLSITPRVVRNVERADVTVAEFWSGTEATLRSQPISLKPAPVAAKDAGAAKPAAAPAAAAGAAAVGATAASTPSPAAAAAPAAEASAVAAEVLLRWSGPSRAKVGDEVTVELVGTLKRPLSNASLQFSYDAKAFTVVAVEEGDLLKTGQARTMLNHKVDPAAGKVLVSIARTGQPLVGEGPLVKLRLKPVAVTPKAELQAVLSAPIGLAGMGMTMTASPGAPLALAVTKD
jgi:general secretion pathway protein D